MKAWSDLLERSRSLAPNGRDGIRLANLAIAAHLGGIQRPRARGAGSALARTIEALAVEPLHVETAHTASWSQLAKSAAVAATALRGSSGKDDWAALFQQADPARKSRGAYATPQRLARPMAQMLLQGRRIPRRILDPSAGAGGLLVATLHELIRLDPRHSPRVHARRLHGIELDPVARELCCLAVWLAADRQILPRSVGQQVVVDNAITRNWWSGDAYEGLIMNPPWDSLRDSAAPDGDQRARDATVRRLNEPQGGTPELPRLYTAQGRGDRNLYKAFLELAPHLLVAGGRIVALVPGAWSSDLGTRLLRQFYLEHLSLDQWTSFENRRHYFPIDERYKFGVLAGARDRKGTATLKVRGFADNANQLGRRHVHLPTTALRRLGGRAEIIPDLTSAAERNLLLRASQDGIPFFDNAGPFGSVTYDREVDLTEDRKRGLFARLEDLDAVPFGDGVWHASTGERLVPLVEGRMVGQYEFFEKSWISGAGRTAVWTYTNGHALASCRPQFLSSPTERVRHRLAICDVTSATNTRTVRATWVPTAWRCGNTAPVLAFDSEAQALAALAVLNSMTFDWFARHIVAGLHLNRFYLEAFHWPDVSESDVSELSRAAARLQALSPRHAGLGRRTFGPTPARLGFVAAHAAIETIVANGYGLRQSDLRLIYSADPAIRRGLWRHFASDPHATAVVNEAIKNSRRRASIQHR